MTTRGEHGGAPSKAGEGLVVTRGCEDERYQVPVSFLGAGLVAWPLRVSLFTEPAAALREVYKRE